jgi:glycosyltransferase involved in cell wall biosynthesis
LQRARAFVFAAEEDFGIAPLEAQACGTPVIALGKGGVLETLQGEDSPEPTAVFFPEQTVTALVAALGRFESGEHGISPAACRANALRFSPERFQSQLSEYVGGEVRSFAEARALYREHEAMAFSPMSTSGR